MFGPLSLSRLAHQNVYFFYLSSRYRWSDFAQRLIRGYSSTTIAEPILVVGIDRDSKFQEDQLRDMKATKQGKSSRSKRGKVLGKVSRRRSLSSNKTAIAALRAALHATEEVEQASQTQDLETTHKMDSRDVLRDTNLISELPSTPKPPTTLDNKAAKKATTRTKKAVPNPKPSTVLDSEDAKSDRNFAKKSSIKSKKSTISNDQDATISSSGIRKRTDRPVSSIDLAALGGSGVHSSGIVSLAPSVQALEAKIVAQLPADSSEEAGVATHMKKRGKIGRARRSAKSTEMKEDPVNEIDSTEAERKDYLTANTLTGQALLSVIKGEILDSKTKKLLVGHLRSYLRFNPVLPSSKESQGSRILRKTTESKRARVARTVKRAGSKSVKATTNMLRALDEKVNRQPQMSGCEIQTVVSSDLALIPLEMPQPPVPNLAYGLERVLFNPGVYHLRDPRSRVFNFDPYLQSIMPVADFDFNALKEYITSSRDKALLSIASAERMKFTGSTSSMTSALAHFHFLLSQWRPVNISKLSQGFPETLRTFTALQRAPSGIFLRWRDGVYAIDADKEFDSSNILMMLGKSMEKLMTMPTNDFERYRKENPDRISAEERNEAESFHYTTMGDILMRSQLDAFDPRLPGTGMFDLKTRAVVSIRMDAKNYHDGLGYEIRSRHGEFESYEREYYDMIRAAFLKYSLQVRMGRMDGIFVAFHNTERIFGFQYISLPEMDFALHGQENLAVGDSEFKLSLDLLNRVLDRATAKFPEQSLRLFFETKETGTPFMCIFAEPMTEPEIQQIQESNKQEIEEYERTVLGLHDDTSSEKSDVDAAKVELDNLQSKVEKSEVEQDKTKWEELQAKVEETLSHDELEVLDENEIQDEAKYITTGSDPRIYPTSIVERSVEGAPVRLSDGPFYVLDTEGEQQDDHVEVVEGIVDDDLDLETLNDGAGQPLDIEGTEGVIGGEEREICETEPKTVKKDDETLEVPVTESEGALNISGEAGERGKAKEEERDLLAMTLTIRNKVNGKYVIRPMNLGSGDSWSVEYVFAEVPKLDRARKLYAQTQSRRKRALSRSKADNKNRLNAAYTERLKKLSRAGREWRQEQDAVDLGKPAKVLENASVAALENSTLS